MITILNFGGQYCHLIARRVRELNVQSEIVPYDASYAKIRALNPSGIILSGGPASIYDKGAPKCDPKIFMSRFPILGICYGHQLIADFFGGKVGKEETRGYGRQTLHIRQNSHFFEGLQNDEVVWVSHGDKVTRLPQGFVNLGSTDTSEIAAMGDLERNIYGVQFHPEVVHTPSGTRILDNFLNICGAPRDYHIEDLEAKLIEEIKEKVHGEKVVMAVSGGVDSYVVANLLRRAIGSQLYLACVDNGLLRKEDLPHVQDLYNDFPNFTLVDASDRFLTALKGIVNPEQKRKIIRDTFWKVFEEYAKPLGAVFLGQGTLYPDRIESAQPSKSADVIKTHHNIGGNLSLSLVEPLRDLYKDEVRKLGIAMGLQKEYLFRHPFPGPGLAIRIVGGAVTRERLGIVRQADHIFVSELRQEGLYDKVWQALAALGCMRTVGVQGDARTYQYPIFLRAVTGEDAMTMDWARLPAKFIEKVSSRIVNEVEGVNRVFYDVTQKPPGTIEYE
ncbi:glutamine-hydrolyzing GMP synthase [Candidatus Woesearchaeota archaeon]|nr:MAG: glutamine-hydrolyzing GMP synthase [Candidatus Woesearchaeota archaeon]